MITYETAPNTSRIHVRLDGKIVGYIREIPTGYQAGMYQYLPGGRVGFGGEVFTDLQKLMDGLEND
jgi:hypothetical protein